MNVTQVDFVRRTWPRWVAWATLGFGSLCVLASATTWKQMTQASREAAKVAEVSPQPADPHLAQRNAQQAAIADVLRSSLQVDWQHVFSALEAQPPQGVVLLALETDQASRSLRLTGLADKPQSAAAYVSQLGSAGLHEVRLLGHQAVTAKPPPWRIRFTVSARWSPTHE